MLLYLFLEVDEIDFIPLMRANIASSLLVTSISTTRAEFPGIWKETDNLGSVREGESFMGSIGIKAIPASAIHKNATISVNEETFGDSLLILTIHV